MIIDEFIDCFNNLNIKHDFVTLSQKNKLSYKNTKQDLTATKKFGWRCTYPSCSSTCETNGCIVDDLMQSMWRHIQDTGLTTVYRTSSKHRFLLKLPLVLVFCPSHGVENFNTTKKKLDAEDPNTSKIEEFYTYLESIITFETEVFKEFLAFSNAYLNVFYKS
ncbi:hypothetical protein BpHYR1_021339 [Brachionus plicatilis]|uniref:Uncharacterized protein n=1 Tax=Brachionus plicatilis TaxID=10195 RepID=A0A3M7QA38_BRAPC|nr:hypothetical protein BpHYR1_021339 [Brachionus plicatilis]